jgi:hypothetical protein
MASGDLVPSDPDRLEPASAEVEFALVIARMIDSVRNSPDHMRQAIYDLARYKLQEQFTYADAKDVKRTQQALETAIRGVEAFSKQHPRIAAPTSPPQLGGPEPASEPAGLPAPEFVSQVRPRPRLEAGAEPESKPTHVPWPHLKRTAAMIAILVGILVAFQQRERLVSLAHNLPRFERQTAPEGRPLPAQAVNDPAPAPPPPKPAPLRPTDYGVYAISNDALAELHLLPGRAPDIRVAVSAALKTPSETLLPNGHPKFIVFRREVASNIADHAEVRIIAKVAREFSADIAGKKPSEGDDTWVIRNVSFPFRSSPLADNPDMYELHSEDPALELTPGRYALILKNQSYDFSVEGETVDPRQCIERIVAANGTYYSDCKKL